MRKLNTLFAALAFTAGMQAANTVFSADLSTATADDFAAWTVIDANQDEKTWGFSEDGTPSHVYYSYHSTNSGDDWLISPVINVPVAGTYVISYEYRGSAYGENLEVWTGSAPTVDGMTEKVASYTDLRDNIAKELLFVDLPAGSIHIGFHCVSDPDKFRLYINSLELIEASNPVDIMVSGFVAPVSGENLGEETVTVTVTNAGRVAVDGFDVSFSVNDGEAVTEHCNSTIGIGESLDYTFNAKADLSQGHFTHSLKAWTSHPDDLNPSNDAATVNVKHIAPASVPYFMGFEPTDDMDEFVFLNLNEDDGDWSRNIDGGWFGSFARTGLGSLCYNYSKQQADDWAIFEPIFAEPGYYAVKFWYSATENHKERLRVYYGDKPTPEAMTNLIVEYDEIDNPNYLESINIIEVKEAGPVYIGFYCCSDADENWLCIDDFSMTSVDPDASDIVLSNLTSPTDYFFSASSRAAAFTMQNVGIKDVTADINYYLNEELLKTTSVSIRGQEVIKVTEESVIPENLEPGVYNFKAEAVFEGDTDLSNNIVEKKIIVLDTPVAFWDFEGEELPSDLTFRKEDSATDHPNAGEEFNEDGFGIFNIVEHFLLGEHVLAVNTWFTEDRSADRWIVLPQLTVTGENAHFSWAANSYNKSYPEYYQVKVSTGEDYWWDYNTLYSNSAEDVTPQTRGVSLADYEGQKIYVAINVRTSNGEAILFDNLGVYGDVEIEGASVTGIASDSDVRVAAEGDNLIVEGAEALNVSVYAFDGSLKAEGKGNILNITNLAKGLYIARVTTSKGSKSLKFVK